MRKRSTPCSSAARARACKNRYRYRSRCTSGKPSSAGLAFAKKLEGDVPDEPARRDAKTLTVKALRFSSQTTHRAP